MPNGTQYGDDGSEPHNIEPCVRKDKSDLSLRTQGSILCGSDPSSPYWVPFGIDQQKDDYREAGDGASSVSPTDHIASASLGRVGAEFDRGLPHRSSTAASS